MLFFAKMNFTKNSGGDAAVELSVVAKQVGGHFLLFISCIFSVYTIVADLSTILLF